VEATGKILRILVVCTGFVALAVQTLTVWYGLKKTKMSEDWKPNDKQHSTN